MNESKKVESMNNTHEDLERLMAKAEQMREAQRDYFRNRSGPSKETWLNKAKKLEQEFDQVLATLRKKGLSPDKFKTNTTQGNLL